MVKPMLSGICGILEESNTSGPETLMMRRIITNMICITGPNLLVPGPERLFYFCFFEYNVFFELDRISNFSIFSVRVRGFFG